MVDIGSRYAVDCETSELAAARYPKKFFFLKSFYFARHSFSVLGDCRYPLQIEILVKLILIRHAGSLVEQLWFKQRMTSMFSPRIAAGRSRFHV